MNSSSNDTPELAFYPVSSERWPDLTTLFEAHGNPNYCWCMRWRVQSKVFGQADSAGRREQLASRVRSNTPVGVLAYAAGRPVGWCSIAPRETYLLLENSTTLKRIDNQPVWSVACFFVTPGMRKQGLAVKLLQAAVSYAVSCGATIVEGYPVEPGKSYQFMGSPAVFEQAAFREAGVARNGRSIVRFHAE